MKKTAYKKMNRSRLAKILTKNRSNRSMGGSILLFFFLFLLASVSLFPVLFMINNAFKPINELFIFPPRLFVMQPTGANFSDLFELLANSLVPFLRYFFNTLIIVLAGSIGHIMFASMAAFPLAKFRFPGNAFLSKLILFSLMFSPAVTAVPSYVILARLRLVDTYWSSIIPAFAMPLGLFLMKNFMEQVPDALIDAASIDGVGYFGMLWRIIMPAVKPAWVTLFIVSFQTLWGVAGGSFIYTENLKPLASMLTQIAGSGIAAGSAGVARIGIVAAASLLMFIVPVIIFVISQSNVLETMVSSGIKE
ncbi:MAG: carbohydrate ABC transporter permease [Treponema sp.]